MKRRGEMTKTLLILGGVILLLVFAPADPVLAQGCVVEPPGALGRWSADLVSGNYRRGRRGWTQRNNGRRCRNCSWEGWECV
jgi:hypothetical protein